MQNLQDVVTQLKHSVDILNQLVSVGFKCKEGRIDAPDTIEDISSKRPSSPIVTIAKQPSSSDSEPDSVSTFISIINNFVLGQFKSTKSLDQFLHQTITGNTLRLDLVSFVTDTAVAEIIHHLLSFR